VSVILASMDAILQDKELAHTHKEALNQCCRLISSLYTKAKPKDSTSKDAFQRQARRDEDAHIGVICCAMSLFMDDGEFQKQALFALSRAMTESQKNRTLVGREAIKVILQVCHAHKNDELVPETAVCALQAVLLDIDDNGMCFAEESAMQLLFEIM
jgi:hypothetical protein